MSTPPNIKGILFDFNGTLFFDSPLHIRAFKEYFTAHGKPEPSVETIVHNIFGRTNKKIYSDFFVEDPTDEQWQTFAEEKEGLYRSYCLSDPSLLQYAAGVEEMLDYLKANGIPFCLATGSGIDNLSFYFEHMGLGRWFDMSNIVYFDGSFAGKPAPDTYLRAAQRLGLDPCDCVVFEDGTSGMVAARRAEAGAVVCIYESCLPSPITADTPVDGVYHDFSDWRQMLAKLGILR